MAEPTSTPAHPAVPERHRVSTRVATRFARHLVAGETVVDACPVWFARPAGREGGGGRLAFTTRHRAWFARTDDDRILLVDRRRGERDHLLAATRIVNLELVGVHPVRPFLQLQLMAAGELPLVLELRLRDRGRARRLVALIDGTDETGTDETGALAPA